LSTLRVKQAANIAEQVVEEMGITSLPVDPILIAKKKGIEVRAAALDGFHGCLMIQGGIAGILYSTSIQNIGFQNFTIGHEIGHYCLPDHIQKLFTPGITVHRSKGAYLFKDPIEDEADKFSASLLMPEKLFKKAIAEIQGHGMDTIESLAELCKTSLTSTAYRYSELAPFTSAVIMGSGRNVESCVCSPEMRDMFPGRHLRKGDLLPSASKTLAFNLKDSNVKNCVKAEGDGYLSDWFTNAEPHEVLEDVIGL
jgi:Zn-dependent peptidase ImmA (M78 family)